MQILSERRESLFGHSWPFPEMAYYVDHQGVWMNSGVAGRPNSVQRAARWEPAHRLLKVAWNILVDDHENNNSALRWPLLYKTIHSGGFPYVAYYGDNRKCSYRNWKNHSLPVFTTCTSLDCNYSFPFPTFRSMVDSKNSTVAWKETTAERNNQYPWDSKQRKVVWRGTFWTNLPHGQESIRSKLLKQVSGRLPNPYFDVLATQAIDASDFSYLPDDADLSAVGGLASTEMVMEDFQNYVAVLDMDGMSWSSRFGALLCYNSVVLKVEPEFVDYFHFDLTPWKHYIPIKGDLSDLDEIAAFALDSKNDARIQKIIRAANDWCHTNMLETKLGEDALDVWESYVGHLNRHDADWQRTWNDAKVSLRMTQRVTDE